MVKKKQAMCYVNVIDKEKVCERDENVYVMLTKQSKRSRARLSSIDLSNNIIERLCEVKANEPVRNEVTRERG